MTALVEDKRALLCWCPQKPVDLHYKCPFAIWNCLSFSDPRFNTMYACHRSSTCMYEWSFYFDIVFSVSILVNFKLP